MAYSPEVVKKARMRLAQAKADRESENNQHRAEAYRRIPRLWEIDQQLRESMALAAQAVFLEGGDARQAMEAVKRTNQGLQQERAALVSLHFEEGYLDESPICDCCGGSGYVGSSMCECLQELCRQEQKKELSLLSGGRENFSQFRLDYYPDQHDPKYGASPRQIMERNFLHCRRYATTFTAHSSNLLFVGGTGLGKTFLSACIARTVADRGYSVMYEPAGHLFTKLEQAKFTASEDARREAARLKNCDLLIVDDLGTEMSGPFVTAALYDLINDRLLDNMPTIISTNLNVDELARRYSPQIASRLRGHFTMLPFVGEDIRVLKQKGL